MSAPKTMTMPTTAAPANKPSARNLPASSTAAAIKVQRAEQPNSGGGSAIHQSSNLLVDKSTQQQAGGKMSGSLITSSTSGDPLDQLIDGKFNELAKRILSELKQQQYSREFFRTLDDILNEPLRSKFTHIDRLKLAAMPKQQQPPVSYYAANYQHHDATSYSNQPKSLPVEVIHEQLEAGGAERDERFGRAAERKLFSLSPVKQHPRQAQSQQVQQQQQGQQGLFPMSKSATISDAANYARPTRFGPLLANNKLLADYPKRKQFGQNNDFADADDDGDREDDDGGDDDDDDDDLDEEDIDDVDDFYQELADDYLQHHRDSFLTNSGGHRLAKRAQASDTITTTTNQEGARSTSSSRLRPAANRNPIQRSNTVGAAAGDLKAAAALRQASNSQRQQQRVLSSLYKTNMNYSTSVLGSHRLSDDDEIIIIPTIQSPSMLSNSSIEASSQANAVSSAPSGQAGDLSGTDSEQIERFSISRTKSFWERLSKAPNGQGKRRASASGAKLTAASDSNQNRPAASGPDQRLAGSKLVGVRVNGHSHALPDSTTTAASSPLAPKQLNYNSSSGDENNSGSHQYHPRRHQHQGAAIKMSAGGAASRGQFGRQHEQSEQQQQQALSEQQQREQEMNRQNRFRQTR